MALQTIVHLLFWFENNVYCGSFKGCLRIVYNTSYVMCRCHYQNWMQFRRGAALLHCIVRLFHISITDRWQLVQPHLCALCLTIFVRFRLYLNFILVKREKENERHIRKVQSSLFHSFVQKFNVGTVWMLRRRQYNSTYRKLIFRKFKHSVNAKCNEIVSDYLSLHVYFLFFLFIEHPSDD